MDEPDSPDTLAWTQNRCTLRESRAYTRFSDESCAAFYTRRPRSGLFSVSTVQSAGRPNLPSQSRQPHSTIIVCYLEICYRLAN